MYKYLFKSLLSILMETYLKVELLDHMVILCLIFEKPSYSFPQQLHHLTFSPETQETPISPHPGQLLLFSVFLIIAILWGMT